MIEDRNFVNYTSTASMPRAILLLLSIELVVLKSLQISSLNFRFVSYDIVWNTMGLRVNHVSNNFLSSFN